MRAPGTRWAAGACADVLLIATYQLVDAGVPEARRAEAGAWVTTAYNLGAALGTAAGGALTAGLGPRMSFAVMAALAAACALAAGCPGLPRVPLPWNRGDGCRH
jgi:predicted MFS family arabinose efflux permease